jgi:hypothetical protein
MIKRLEAWLRDRERGYSIRDRTMARLKLIAASGDYRPQVFAEWTLGELHAGKAICEREKKIRA